MKQKGLWRQSLVWVMFGLSACSFGPPLDEARLSTEADAGPDASDSGATPCAQDADCPAPVNTCLDAACRDGLCQQVFHQRACDDSNLCTAQDTCQMGTCQGTPLACPDEATVCDPVVGLCVQCLSSADCDNGLCVDQACVQCRDDADCGGQRICLEGLCLDCAVDADCDDGNPCTQDSCQGRSCAHQERGGLCDDGDACTNDDTCIAGVCRGEATICDIGQSCVQGRCLDCDTAQDCPEGFLCSQRLCVECIGADDARCDDNNPCTIDACVDGLCQSSPLTDAQSCTLGENKEGRCHEGRCVECIQAADCQADPCQAAICNAEGRCVRQQEPDGAACGDGREVTISCGLWETERSCQVCQQGQCVDRYGASCRPDCAQAVDACRVVPMATCGGGCQYGRLQQNGSVEDSQGACCFYTLLDDDPCQ